MQNEPTGPMLAALLADLEQLDLEKTPTAPTLAALAKTLARSLDEEPNASTARELRYVMNALATIAAPQREDELSRFLADLSPFANRDEGDGPMIY